LALDALAARTSTLLTGAEIPHLLIKGPATARWLYPNQPNVRPYTDVDILVRVDRFDDAQAVLDNNGYHAKLSGLRAGEGCWHEAGWRPDNVDRLAVDLHRSSAGVGRAAAYFDLLAASAESLNVAGRSISIPSEVATALIVALHAAHPGRAHKPLVDIRRANDLFDREVWQGAAELARQCDAESSFRAGLGLLADGDRLADELSVGGQVPVSTWLTGRHRAQASVSLALVLAKPGFTGRLRHVLSRLLPSPASIRLTDASAGRGLPWLAAAYVRRLIVVVMSLPRAISDVLEARRALRTVGDGSGAVSRAANAGRKLRHVDVLAVRSALWTLRTRADSAKQLRFGGLPGVRLTAPPSLRPKDRRVVVSLLRALGASCLERSLVLQRFDAATGMARTVIIGVTSPGRGFRAHAWLAGEPQRDGDFREIVRHEIPIGPAPSSQAIGSAGLGFL
jgi:hypothetical protein